MTAPDPRLEEIEGRLEAAGALGIGWSALPALTDDKVIMFRVYDDEGHCIAECSDMAVANLAGHTPADVAYLLAELRKAQDKLDEFMAKYGAHTSENQGRDCPACNAAIRVKRRAAVADAAGGGE